MRRLIGSREQQLVFLNIHWGVQYAFALPAAPDGQWTATARFGPGDRLNGDSAGELLEQVRHHYQASVSSASGASWLPGLLGALPGLPGALPGLLGAHRAGPVTTRGGMASIRHS